MPTAPFKFGSSTFGSSFYGGAPVIESLVKSDLFDISIGGRDFQIDWKAEVPLDFQTVPTNRAQQDGSDAPGEQSLNPDGLWRRSGESWHFGSGQEQYDRKDSNQFRARRSFNMNVWDKWHLSALKACDYKTLSVNTNQRFAIAGTRFYKVDGATLSFSTDLTPDTPSFTSCTGHPVNAATSIATDGFHVWTAHGSNGVYRTDTSTSAMTQVITTGTVTLLGWVRNRLMAGNNNSIYDITAPGMGTPAVLPAALYTNANTSFVFKSFAEGSGFIYAAGYVGSKSLIFKITLQPDGTALTAPSIAADIATGEQVECIYGYLGRFVAIGLNKGFRLSVVGDTGDLTLGSLVLTDNPVLTFDGEGPFIYYGVTTFTNPVDNAAYSGIGRMSTEFFVDIQTLQPAYANDIMVANNISSPGITSIGTFNGQKVFNINSVGIIATTNNLAPSAWIETGLISFGMTEFKRGMFVDHHHSGVGTLQIYLSVDGGTFTLIGEHMVINPEEMMPTFALGEPLNRTLEFRYVLIPDEGDATLGLSFHSWLLRSEPVPEVTNMVFTTIYAAPLIENLIEYPVAYDIGDTLLFFENMHQSKTVETLVTKFITTNVVLEDWDSPVKNIEYGRDGYVGANLDITLKFKRISALGVTSA